MDYLTKGITRQQIRDLSVFFRELYGADTKGKFPVLEALEKFPDIFSGSTVEILDNDELSAKIPAQCIANTDGTFTIQIRQATYDGAYNDVGAFRGFIVHELCHSFLYAVGFTPIMQRSFKDNEISCYCSSEWQAKAMCGEVMMPYEESQNMTFDEIRSYYGVSKSSAFYRLKKY